MDQSTQPKRRTPTEYRDASWCCTLPFDPVKNGFGIGFNLEDKEVVRLLLDRDSAVDLIETLANYLGIHVQSSASDEFPRSYVSISEHNRQAKLIQYRAILEDLKESRQDLGADSKGYNRLIERSLSLIRDDGYIDFALRSIIIHLQNLGHDRQDHSI